MTDILREILKSFDYTQELLICALILTRTMAMVMYTPFLAGHIAPMEVKMGLGVLITATVWPVAHSSMTAPIPMLAIPFFLLMLKEVFIGLMLGFANDFVVMEMAGRIIDTVRGSSMAEVMVPHTGQRATPAGDLYYHLLLMIFVSMGGIGAFMSIYFFSFGAIPLNVHIPTSANELWAFTDYLMGHSGGFLVHALLLAGPVIAATLVTDVVFGILNRVAPQLNAYFMAMPVKAVGGIIMMLVIMDAYVERTSSYVVELLAGAEKTIELLTR
jgi:flagellar biosynthesis protein FliR